VREALLSVVICGLLNTVSHRIIRRRLEATQKLNVDELMLLLASVIEASGITHCEDLTALSTRTKKIKKKKKLVQLHIWDVMLM
jgi:hypothetical protein